MTPREYEVVLKSAKPAKYIRSISDMLESYPMVECFMVLDNTTPGHDKVYVLLTYRGCNGELWMARLWGKRGTTLSRMTEAIQGHEFDAILEKKLAKGYEQLPEDQADDALIRQVLEYVKSILHQQQVNSPEYH